jgi:hypothetical protein
MEKAHPCLLNGQHFLANDPIFKMKGLRTVPSFPESAICLKNAIHHQSLEKSVWQGNQALLHSLGRSSLKSSTRQKEDDQ